MHTRHNFRGYDACDVGKCELLTLTFNPITWSFKNIFWPHLSVTFRSYYPNFIAFSLNKIILVYNVQWFTFCQIQCIQPDTDQKLQFFITYLYLTTLVRVNPLKFCHDVCYEKTRMTGLPGGENSLMISASHFHRAQEESDRQTDKWRKLLWHILSLHAMHYDHVIKSRNN